MSWRDNLKDFLEVIIGRLNRVTPNPEAVPVFEGKPSSLFSDLGTSNACLPGVLQPTISPFNIRSIWGQDPDNRQCHGILTVIPGGGPEEQGAADVFMYINCQKVTFSELNDYWKQKPPIETRAKTRKHINEVLVGLAEEFNKRGDLSTARVCIQNARLIGRGRHVAATHTDKSLDLK